MKKALEIWFPTLFCAFISLTAVFLLIIKDQSSVWAISFLCFLPLCFLQIGQTLWRLHKEIHSLREQTAELQRPSLGNKK